MANISHQKLSIVIPVKDEEKSLERLISEIKKVISKLKNEYEIIFIDDGSKDNTFEKMLSLARKDKKIKIIKLRGNFGKSVGLQIGFNNTTGDLVFTMDADLQDDPNEIPKMIAKINEGYDLVSGWKKKRHDPISKTLPSKVINTLVRIMTGLKLHDINCGFKVYRKEVIKNLNLYGDLYRFIPILVYRQNYRVAEIEVKHRARKFGRSKYSWKRFISGWLDLLTVFFLIRYLRRPGHFFGGLGVISFLGGFLIGVYITFLRLVTGNIQYRYPLLFLGMLLMIIGIQLISSGLLAEFIIYNKEKQDYSSYIEKRG